MKKYLTGMVALSIAGLVTQTALAAGTTSNLKVVVNGISNPGGVIRIALFNSGTAYNNSRYSAAGAYQTATTSIHGNSASTSFSNLPYGNYGIKVFQDMDNSGTLKVNGMGIPQEPYGFSNNASATWHMPSFSAIQFQVNQPNSMQTITLQHAGK
ncbi:MAG: DUF2141 domain-containing protein [Gammaproteobacteria bacterium]